MVTQVFLENQEPCHHFFRFIPLENFTIHWSRIASARRTKSFRDSQHQSGETRRHQGAGDLDHRWVIKEGQHTGFHWISEVIWISKRSDHCHLMFLKLISEIWESATMDPTMNSTENGGVELKDRFHHHINSHSRILDWRYLPYIRPIFQAYF